MSNIADGTEFRKVLLKKTPDGFTKDHIEDVLDAIPEAIAEWLHESEPTSEGKYHGQIKDLFVVELAQVAESKGHGVAEGTTEAEHLAVYVKCSEGMLRVLSAKFGKRVKNG